MKRSTKYIIISASALICLVAIAIVVAVSLPEDRVDIGPVGNDFRVANYSQTHSYAQLGVIDGTLYMFSEDELYCFTDGRFERIASNGYSGIAIVDGKYIYRRKPVEGPNIDFASGNIYQVHSYIYKLHRDYNDLCHIYSYDPITGEHVFVRQMVHVADDNDFCTADGTWYIYDWDLHQIYALKDGEMTETAQFETYRMGDNRYSLEYQDDRWDFVRYDKNGARTVYDDLRSESFVIPCSDWLMVGIVSLYGEIYTVHGETGEVSLLFSENGVYTDTTVNTHNGDVYLAVVRYPEEGFLHPVTSENDEKTGLYRISLEDGSMEKISDEIYCGLFIFDDTGIYACRGDGIICKIDFDGNLIAELPGFEGHMKYWGG